MYNMESMSTDTPTASGAPARRFYGSVTVGERGQIAIPAQARRDHGFEPGQKLIVLGNEDGVALMSAERLLALLDDSSALAALVASARADG